MKTISVLGATGSVGTQALDVARKRGYRVDFISANRDVAATERAAREFRPAAVAMADDSSARILKTALADTDIRVYSGTDGICRGVSESESETVVNSILGGAGLLPSLAVIDAGKRLALANKESLVVAGDIVMERARARGVEILPVDSEHSAIYQSLKSGRSSEIKKILLTASGGPFYGMSRRELERVTREDALRHPTWKMGKKITVDSATLMNKGFEIIEAVHLFGVSSDMVEVIIHRESILHSAVEYVDNSIIAELSVPDMRMCVQYAVDYPDRCESVSNELDLTALLNLSFKAPDTDAFPFLKLAKRAIADGGAMPAIMNATDEIAVEAFLSDSLGFTGIYDVVFDVYERMSDSASVRELDGIIEKDKEARLIAAELIKKKQ